MVRSGEFRGRCRGSPLLALLPEYRSVCRCWHPRCLVIGLAFALLLSLKLGNVSTLMACLFTVPWVISPVVAGFAWKWLLNDQFGIINLWLANLGLAKIGTSWLGDPTTALLCVMAARVWQFYPFAMVVFLAGLQTIPQEQFEAAAVDGATPFRRFFIIV
jgi:ABC-type sugar transport system permease subunit